MRLVFLILALGSLFTVGAEDIRYSRVDSGIVKRRLEAATADNHDRRVALSDMLGKAGCDVRTQDVKRTREPNVICTLPGETDSVILVGAHFDLVDVGAGVADNWSGAVMLPTLYQSLSKEPRRHTFVFVGFTAEEKGLVGSRFYVKMLSKEQRKRIVAMVNLDTLGLGPTKVWPSQSDKKLVQDVANVAHSLKLPLGAVNADQVGTSDHHSFQARKIPCLVVHSVTQETFPILHSVRDDLSAIQFDDCYDTYMLLAAYLAYADQQLTPQE